jgi:hypothetical protein
MSPVQSKKSFAQLPIGPPPGETQPGFLQRSASAEVKMRIAAFFAYILDTNESSIVQNGTIFKSRQEAMEAVRQGFMYVKKLERRFVNPQVTVISPEVALLTSEGTVAATLTGGRTMDARFAVSLIFVRKDGEWRLLHGHYSAPERM